MIRRHNQYWLGVIITAGAASLLAGTHQGEPGKTARPPLVGAAAASHPVAGPYARARMSFEANAGQADPRADFIARGRNYSLLLSGREAILDLHRELPAASGRAHSPASTASTASTASFRMALAGAALHPRATSTDPQRGVSNYFIGPDRKKWLTGVPHYGSVRYNGVYPGIDVVYYGNPDRLEHDFVVHPGARASKINLAFSRPGKANSSENLRLGADGGLIVPVAGGSVELEKPVAYQEANGQRTPVDARYTMKGGHSVGFAVASYDVHKPLIIDPILNYTTYVGGSDEDHANAIAVDTADDAYITGYTQSQDFVVTDGSTPQGGKDVFVTKLDPNGNILYSTYIGGAGDDIGAGIAVDSSNSAYVVGSTTSGGSFPIPSGGVYESTSHGGQDAFALKLTAAGAISYSTFLGGSQNDAATSVAVNSAGQIYVAGQTSSSDFPVTAGSFQVTPNGATCGFVTKLSAGAAGLIYSTLIGGGASDSVNAIALNGAGQACIAGSTSSTTFQQVNELQVSPTNADGYASVLNANGSGLVYSTLIPSTTSANGIAVDSQNSRLYVTGTTAGGAFLTTAGAQQTTYGGGASDAFAICLDPSQSGAQTLVYGTYLGGSGADQGLAIAVDAYHQAHVTGSTSSGDFPLVNPLASYPGYSGGLDAFVAKLAPTGALIYSTYLGTPGDDSGNGIAIDNAGSAYVAGYAQSGGLVGATSFGPGGLSDAFVAKIEDAPQPPTTVTATAVSAGDIHLTWAAASTNQDGFTISRSDPTSGTFTTIAQVGPNTVSFDDTAATDNNPPTTGLTYTYQISAFKDTTSGVLSSNPASSQVTVPQPPTNLVASVPAAPPGQTTVNLTWTDATNDATYFQVWRSSGTSPAVLVMNNIPAATTNYTDSTLSASSTYTYYIVAVNLTNNPSGSGTGYSLPSNTQTVTTLPNATPAPTNFVATVPPAPAGTTEIDLSWAPGGSNQSGFIIQREPAGGSFSTVAVVGPNVTSYQDTGLTPDTPYQYLIFAYNASGDSAADGPVDARTLPTVPAAPTNLVATVPASPLGAMEIVLSWTRNSNNETGFQIYRQTGGSGAFVLIATASAGSTSYTDTGLQPDTKYAYEIDATNAGGSSTLTSPAVLATTRVLPPSPPVLSGSVNSQTSVTLTWTPSDNSQTGYLLYRQTGTGAFALVADQSVLGKATTSYTDSGLSPNTTYTYKLDAVDQGTDVSGQPFTVTSTDSNLLSLSTLPNLPQSPIALSATPASPTEIDLTWQDNNADFTQYIVEREASGASTFNVIATLTTTNASGSYADMGVVPNTTYTYEVLASNSAGNSTPSLPAVATTPPLPPVGATNLTATPVSQTQINLSWMSSDPTVTSYLVQRENPGATSFQTIFTINNPNQTTYQDTGLTPGSGYTYQVVAANAGGDAPPSNQATASTFPAAPGAPASLTATPDPSLGKTQINLTWTDPAGDATGFLVQRRNPGSVSFTTIATIGNGATTGYSDTGLTPNSTYAYQIVATNANGLQSSSPSNIAVASTFPNPPLAPTGLSVTVPAAPAGQTSLKLSWTPGDNTQKNFVILRGSSITGPFTTLATVPGTQQTYTDTGLTPGTLYVYEVQASNQGGASSPSSPASASTLPNLPAAPINLTVTTPVPPAGQTQLDLSWTDTTGDATGFKIQRKTGAGAFKDIVSVGAPAAQTEFSFTDSGLAPNTTYTYQVIATNAAGSSPASTQQSGTTLPNAPTAPVLKSATAVNQTQVNLVWTWTQGSGTAADSFEVLRQINGSFQIIATVQNTGQSSYTYSDSPLTANTTYVYEIEAVNTGGASAPSAALSVTTLPNPPGTPLSFTAVPQVSSSGKPQVQLNWSPAGNNQTGFVITRSGLATPITISNPNATSYLDSSASLAPDTVYTYQIVATIGSVQSSPSIVSVRTLPVPPVAPTSATATAVSATEIDLTWTDTAGDETGFKIVRTGNGQTVTAGVMNASNTSFQDTGLVPNTTYTYTIYAINSGGSSPATAKATATTFVTPPKGPSALTATAVSSTEVDLSWTDTTGDASGYLVQRQDPGASGFQTIAVVTDPTITTYKDTNPIQATSASVNPTPGVVPIKPTTTYTYQVIATNAGGNSSPSPQAQVTTPVNPPTAPAGFTASATGPNSISLSWTDGANDQTGFTLSREIGTGGFTLLANIAASSTGFIDTSVQPGTTYTYQLAATNSGGNSTSAIAGPVTTPALPPAPPQSPSQPVATPLSQTQISVSWTAGDTTQTEFKVLRQTGGSGSFSLVQVVGPSQFTFNDSGLNPGTTYAYEIVANNSGGDSLASPPSSPVATLPIAPAAPSGLTALVVSQSEIDLSWSLNDATDTGINIQRKTGNGAFTTVNSTPLPAGTTSFADTGLSANTTYTYQIVALNSGGGTASGQVSAATLPNPPITPLGLSATAASQTVVNLKWTNAANSGSGGFIILRGIGTNAPTQLTTIVDPTATSFQDVSAAANTTYVYQVQSENAGGVSAPSNTASVTTPPVPPLPPGQLTATVLSQSQIRLTWTDTNPDVSDPSFTGFVIQRQDPGGALRTIGTVAAGLPSTYLDVNLVPGATYTYDVLASNTGGNSRPSNVVVVSTLPTLPGAPTGLQAVAVSTGQINLTWTSGTGSTVSYNIQRSVGGGPFVQIGTTPAGTTQFSDQTVQAGVTYSYEVTATNASGTSATSNVVTVSSQPNAPGAPLQLSATVKSGTSVTLNWTPADGQATGWVIQRKTGAGSFQTLTPSPALTPNAVTYTDNTVSPNTTYTYQVMAKNSGGTSGPSPSATVTTPVRAPAAPTALSATAISQNEIDLKWTPGDHSQTAWIIERKTGTGTYQTVTQSPALPPSATTFKDTGLAGATTYTYQVIAVNGGGTSAPSPSAAATTFAQAPAAPANVAARAISSSTIVVTWTNPDRLATNFRILGALGNSAFNTMATASAGATSVDVTGLTPNSPYRFEVIAYNGPAQSAPSAVVTATTLMSAPAAPTGLQVVSSASNAVTVSWQFSGSNAAGFYVERAPAGGAFALLNLVNGTTRSYTDTTVRPLTSYTYRTLAYNSGGVSGASNSVNATTPAPPAPPAAPSNLKASAISSTTISLTWTDNSSNESGFKIEMLTGGGSFSQIATTSAGVTGYSVTGLSPSTTYTFRIRATNAGGNSAYSNSASATTLQAIPPAPTGTTAVASSASSVQITWQWSTANPAGFTVERSVNGGAFTQLNLTNGAARSYLDTTAGTAHTTYSYRVRARSTGGSSQPSNTVTITRR